MTKKIFRCSQKCREHEEGILCSRMDGKEIEHDYPSAHPPFYKGCQCTFEVVGEEVKLPLQSVEKDVMPTPTYSFKRGPKDGFKFSSHDIPFNWVLFSRPIKLEPHHLGAYAWVPEDMAALMGVAIHDDITMNLDKNKLYAAYRLQWELDEKFQWKFGTLEGIGAKGVYIFFMYLIKPTS